MTSFIVFNEFTPDSINSILIQPPRPISIPFEAIRSLCILLSGITSKFSLGKPVKLQNFSLPILLPIPTANIFRSAF